MKRRSALVAVLVLVTAGVSTAVAARKADAGDRATARAALAAVHLQVAPDDSPTPLPELTQREVPVFVVALRNTGRTGVVVRSARWRGRDVAVDLAVDPGQDQPLALPQPVACPAHRVTATVDHVDLRVAAAGGERTVRLVLPDPDAPAREVDDRCGLHPAAESVQAAVRTVRARPGQVVLDVALTFSGALATEVLGVRGAAGLDTSVAERLPVALPPGGNDLDGRALPHVLTVTLSKPDCGSLAAEVRRHGAPYTSLFLQVRHVDEPTEQVEISFGADAATTLVAGCHLPPLQELDGVVTEQ